MKRFYKEVSVRDVAGGFVVLLDGRPVKTPKRADLLVPNQGLGEALADEWRRQGETVDLAGMHLNGLASKAIDGLVQDPAPEIEVISAFGGNDLICYRADGPEELVQRQSQGWDPYIDWLDGWLKIRLHITTGITHVEQDAGALGRLRESVAALSPFVLAALHAQVALIGSLVIPLALLKGFRQVDQAWTDATLEEAWSAEKWGVDDEAQTRLENNGVVFTSADRFIRLALD